MDIEKSDFTKYEVARIIGARALQIAMDAPMLLKFSEEELNEIKYDAIKIAERELEAGALPIAINKPLPKKRKDKLRASKEEKINDADIKAKEKEVEKEIAEDARELGFAAEDGEGEDSIQQAANTEEQ